MNTRMLSAAALAMFGAMLATSAIAEDRPPIAKTDAAAAVFGAGSSAVSLDDEALAGHSGAGKGTRPDGKGFGGSPSSLVGQVLPSVIGGAPAAARTGGSQASGQATLGGVATIGGAP